MEVAEPCSICKSRTACDCRRALTAFYSTLERVSRRVSSAEAASTSVALPIAGGGIDKLNLRLFESLPISSVFAAIRQNGLSSAIVFLKNRKPYLEVRKGNGKVHCSLTFDRGAVTGIVSNPNHFKAWQPYFTFLSSILPLPTLETAEISRMDINLDFAVPFQTLIQSIDIRNKRNAVTFSDVSGQRTGLTIGKCSESLTIYDKAKKENLSTPLTRIELR